MIIAIIEVKLYYLRFTTIIIIHNSSIKSSHLVTESNYHPKRQLNQLLSNS
jgi:hypothetical protein